MTPRRCDLVPPPPLGLQGVHSNQILFVLGLLHTTATNAAILMPSTSVSVVVAANLDARRAFTLA